MIFMKDFLRQQAYKNTDFAGLINKYVYTILYILPILKRTLKTMPQYVFQYPIRKSIQTVVYFLLTYNNVRGFT